MLIDETSTLTSSGGVASVLPGSNSPSNVGLEVSLPRRLDDLPSPFVEVSSSDREYSFDTLRACLRAEFRRFMMLIFLSVDVDIWMR